MPWNNQGGGGPWGGGGGGQGPWGNRPGGGPQPPDLEELLRRSQEKVKSLFPGGGTGTGGGGAGPVSRKAIVIVGLVAVAVWLFAGRVAYTVQPDEQGVVLRFGELNRVETPGLRFKLPAPIETVLTPQVTLVNRVEVGFRSAGATAPGQRTTPVREVDNEALMLTGDENIVDINFVVLWRIGDAAQYLFNIRDPENTVKAAAESVVREIVGQRPILEVTTEGRRSIEQQAREQLQGLMTEYGAGILIDEVQLQKADPPAEVIDAFRDVQRAQADRERAQNEAESYQNDIIPRARGDAERLMQEAEAYKQEAIARAQGEAQRFASVLAAYSKAEDVTARRLYLETMEDVLTGMDKVIIDNQASGSGVLPYLPLPALEKRARPADTTQPQAMPGAAQ
ncbi:MAG: FtsH protease activity modulator HflK [Geminicoccaceae bacterium]